MFLHTIFFKSIVQLDLWLYMWLSQQKPALFALKLNSILLPQFTDTLNIYPSPVHQVLNVNWSAFLKGILPTFQSYGWNDGTHGGHQLDSGCLYLLPLALWPTGTYVIGHCVGIMAAHRMSQEVVFATSHPTLPRLPSHPPPYYQCWWQKGMAKIPWNSAIRDRGD